jgi:hypothetical protein
MLRQLLLQVARHLLAMLAVTVGDGEKVAELHTAEMRHRDPHVLVHLVRVTWRDTCLRGEGELGNRVGVHLLGVGRKVAVRRNLALLSLLLFLRLRFRLGALDTEGAFGACIPMVHVDRARSLAAFLGGVLTNL